MGEAFAIYALAVATLGVSVAAALVAAALRGRCRVALDSGRKVRSSSGLSGAEAAVRMLVEQGAEGVSVMECEDGPAYDGSVRRILLPRDNARGADAAALATSCHEAGHAVAHVRGPRNIVVSARLCLASSALSAMWALLLLTTVVVALPQLAAVAVLCWFLAAAFRVPSVLLERDASARALVFIESSLRENPKALSAASRILRNAGILHGVAVLFPAVLETFINPDAM